MVSLNTDNQAHQRDILFTLFPILHSNSALNSSSPPAPSPDSLHSLSFRNCTVSFVTVECTVLTPGTVPQHARNISSSSQSRTRRHPVGRRDPDRAGGLCRTAQALGRCGCHEQVGGKRTIRSPGTGFRRAACGEQSEAILSEVKGKD